MPETRPRRWPSFASRFAVPALISFLFVARCQGGFRQDELECQQAANQLTSCCPGFDATTLSCTYTNGCATYYPALTVQESQCIEDESCETLVSTGVCERAAEALPLASAADQGQGQGGGGQAAVDGGPEANIQVCP